MRDRSNSHVDSNNNIIALTRAVVVKVLLRVDIYSLEQKVAIYLRSDLARLFFEEDFLALLLPAGLLEHARTT